MIVNETGRGTVTKRELPRLSAGYFTPDAIKRAITRLHEVITLFEEAEAERAETAKKDLEAAMVEPAKT